MIESSLVASDYYLLGLAFTDAYEPGTGDEDDPAEFAKSLSPEEAEAALSKIQALGLIDFSDKDSKEWWLNERGLLFCWDHRVQIYEALIDGMPISDLQRFRAAYSSYEQGIFSDYGKFPDELDNGEVPAADRVVTIKDNQKLPELIDMVESAQDVISKSNSVSISTGGWISEHLKLGVQLLKQPKVLIAAVMALLIKPLYAAYEAVVEQAAQAAIYEAIATIRAFFGI